MSSTDITPILARIKNRLETVPNMGPVYAHDVYSRDDLAELIVSEIAGVRTLRAWWITGPLMDARLAEQRAAGFQHRWWTYRITGVDGLVEDQGDDMAAIRALALAASDALDADRTLNSTCHRTWPTSWPEPPGYRVLGVGAAVAMVQLEKRVLTLSTPT